MLRSPRYPFLSLLGRGWAELFAHFAQLRLALTRLRVVATLGLEMDVLGEKLQALKGILSLSSPKNEKVKTVWVEPRPSCSSFFRCINPVQPRVQSSFGEFCVSITLALKQLNF
jgi:hypothetical protein